MTDAAWTILTEAHRKARRAGLGICLAAPLAVAGLAATGLLPPGRSPVTGAFQQLGYTFTGLVFLAAAWMAWRRGRALRGFGQQAEASRIRTLKGEAWRFAVVSASSTLWGALYWSLVGWSGFRHALTFLLLTPVMFLCFMPGLATWARKEAP